MLIDLEQMIGIDVETKNGFILGKLDGLVLETESQTIHQYKVKQSGISHIFDNEILIHKNQIISIEKNKITVDDSTIPEDATQIKNKKENQQPTIAPARPISRSR